MPPDPSTVPADWGLLDAEAQHRSFPDAFPIPTRQERESLQAGDMVKMVFVLDPPPESGPNAERMWVEVRSARDGGYDGWLTNEPKVIPDLEVGTFLAFAPEHVAGIALHTQDVAFDVAHRAVVSCRVLDRSVPPGWVAHDEPVDEIDSGWTVAAGDEPGDYFTGDPAESTRSVTLGELVQRYPSLVEVFQAGTGEWVYRPDHRRYVRVKEPADRVTSEGGPAAGTAPRP
ncbi:MAG: DUF2185 domain-containing protein [Acidimicrobiales bacterium]|nr:DUF2185 domain-containing protein [Acidimicrobiales bacterium]